MICFEYRSKIRTSIAPQDYILAPIGTLVEAAQVDQKGCNTVLADRIMALASPQDIPAGHRDSQAGPQVGLEKVDLAGYKASQPGIR